MRGVIATALALLATHAAQADQWLGPYPQSYVSDRGIYRLTIYPAGSSGPSSETDPVKDIAEGRPRVIPLSRAKAWPEASIEQLRDGRYVQARTVRLVNAVSPASAVISDSDGRFATFDNWGGTGYGDDVVVIYDPEGRVVKKFALEDVVGGKRRLESFPHSISSIQWGGPHHIDAEQGHLVLEILSSGRYRVESPTYRQLRVRLIDGLVVGK